MYLNLFVAQCLFRGRHGHYGIDRWFVEEGGKQHEHVLLDDRVQQGVLRLSVLDVSLAVGRIP